MIILYLFVLSLLCLVRADTEIRNFVVSAEHAAPATPDGAVIDLSPGTNTLQINSSVPELWVHVPLHAGSWTARLSWPGSRPTRFGMAVYPWSEDRLEAKEHAAGVLLHITAEALSPRMKHPFLHRLGLASNPQQVPPDSEFATAFHLLVEPLYFGVLPATAVSAIWGIGVLGAVAALAAPRLLRRISKASRVDAKTE